MLNVFGVYRVGRTIERTGGKNYKKGVILAIACRVGGGGMSDFQHSDMAVVGYWPGVGKRQNHGSFPWEGSSASPDPFKKSAQGFP